MRAKPDCTGQRFGKLVVLGKGGKRPQKKSYIQLWKLQCDCGRIIEIPRSYFELDGQVSCGCKRRLGEVDNKRRPRNISGKKFGTLTAIALTGRKYHQKPTWLMQCDCGNTREMSLSEIRQHESQNRRLCCRDRNQHKDFKLTYPATPNPYPPEASELLKKYLPLTELPFEKVDSEVEDEKRDRLLRAAWIIVYRRQQGEEISELYERRIIKKHLRYCSIDVFWRRQVDKAGGYLLTVRGTKKQIGNMATNITPSDYPTIETLGKTITLPSSGEVPMKRLKFKRC